MKGNRLVLAVLLVCALGLTLSCGDSTPTGVAAAPQPQADLIGGLLGGTGLLSCSSLPYDSMTKVIGPAGGSLRVGPHSFFIPSGALSQQTTITMVLPTAQHVNVVRFKPAGLQFAKPTYLTMSYANCSLLGWLLPKHIADSPSLRPRMPGPGAVRPAADLLHEARASERAGCIPEAIERYEAAIAGAERTGERAILAEALRRLAVVRHQCNESQLARELCQRSEAVATECDNAVLAAEALNTHGAIDVQTGLLDEARRHFLQALERGGSSRELHARVEQNLGVVANIQGELDEARNRYGRSLEAYQDANDEHGCAIAYHNLGMLSADQGLLDEADQHFQKSLAIAQRSGDVHLQGLCLVNHAEVHVARQRYEEAQRNAEAALAIFDQLGAKAVKAEAYRVIGMVYRETGRPGLAESRLRSAIDLASGAEAVLSQAEASRELAILYQAMGRNQEALGFLNSAHRLFRRLDARKDLVHVGGKVAELETTYRAVVREWGQSLESSDSYTFGHCERVAQHAVAMAQQLGLDEQQQTTK